MYRLYTNNKELAKEYVPFLVKNIEKAENNTYFKIDFKIENGEKEWLSFENSTSPSVGLNEIYNMFPNMPDIIFGDLYEIGGSGDSGEEGKTREVKRIYTVEEATEALGTKGKNTFSIRYR